MSRTRREFLGLAASSLALAPLTRQVLARPVKPEGKSLRILILGGTGFIGPYAVRYARLRGHTVTLFNRGRTNVGLFGDLEKLVGDRNTKVGAGLNVLKGRRWDVCLDNTGYVPRHVRDSAQLLKDAVDHYLFTSTRMVYADFLEPGKTEDAPLSTIDDPTTEEVGPNYGPLKVLCEQEVRRAFGERSTIVRPMGVAGPGDRSDRFTYWPVRVNRGGEVLVPGDFTDPIQYIDVRDLAEFMIHMLEKSIGGTFNISGPASDLSMAEFVHGCRAITNSKVRFTWIPAGFLNERDVRGRRELPVWFPPRIPGETRGPVNHDKAVAQGLRFRPLSLTARDTLDWHLSRPKDQQTLPTRLSPERERDILAAWHAQR